MIIPVYNAENYLRACLDSVLSQPLALEVICVDDGSSDGSTAILEEYAARDSRLHLLRQKNPSLLVVSFHLALSYHRKPLVCNKKLAKPCRFL